MATILITGSAGFLGHNLTVRLMRRHRVLAGFYRIRAEVGEPVFLDITQPDEVIRQLGKFKPELVIHAAAMSHPDECEQHPEQARKVIVEGSRHIAVAAQQWQGRLVYISTDLVFDGSKGNYTEEDPVNGISVYSRSKIEAEDLVREIAPSAVVLRVALLYGAGNPFHPGHLDSVLKQWKAGQTLTFYTDQYRTPVFAPQVAEVVEQLLVHREVRGILHLGGAERITRYGFARLIASQVGARATLLRAGSMWDAAGAAPRGADCSLVSSKITKLLGVEPMSCLDGLKTLARQGQLPSIS